MATLFEMQEGGAIRAVASSAAPTLYDAANDHSNEVFAVTVTGSRTTINVEGTFGTPFDETVGGNRNETLNISFNALTYTAASLFRKLRDAYIDNETVDVSVILNDGAVASTNQEAIMTIRVLSMDLVPGTVGQKRVVTGSFPIVGGSLEFVDTNNQATPST
jgi:hypothetical protein